MAADVVIVIIDDNASSLELLASSLASAGVRIICANTPEKGLEIVYREHPQIVVTDLVMPGLSGIDVVERVAEFDPAIDVIVITAHADSSSAVEAIRKGAADYIRKPIPVPLLRERITHVVELAQIRKRDSAAEDLLLRKSQFEGMIGRGPVFWELTARIRRIAPHYRTVLITGETGTGKDLVARALHNLSPVSAGRFVVLNCSAVVETLFESELFGHVRGSFTGADKDKMGLFEFADKGAIFLDEIADMPMGTQAKLLRTLQNHEVLRVGSLTPRMVDVRVIAATNRDLHRAIALKEFREDLYYRLSMIEIRAPSLSERREDLPLLTRYMLDKFSRQFRKPIEGLTQRAQALLGRYAWPGNIRELENALGHACMMTGGKMIDIPDLPEYLKTPGRENASAQPNASSVDDTFDEHEKRLIAHALSKAKGNQSQAARILHIGRDALRYKMKKHGLAHAVAS